MAESEPVVFVTAQSRELAGIGYAMLREQLEAAADRDAAWTRFAVRTLAVETALRPAAVRDIPAPPGSAGLAEISRITSRPVFRISTVTTARNTARTKPLP
ncbi:hypothetical protein, partial [Rothia kristinae]